MNIVDYTEAENVIALFRKEFSELMWNNDIEIVFDDAAYNTICKIDQEQDRLSKVWVEKVLEDMGIRGEQ